MEQNKKFIGFLLLYKVIEGSENLKDMMKEIMTYIPSMDKLYIFNFAEREQLPLIDELAKKYSHTEYATLKSKGEVSDYKTAMDYAIKVGADYATILEAGYFYEDNSYHEMKKHILLNEVEDGVAVISPMPVYTCIDKNDTQVESRLVRGCHLVGTIIDVNIYKTTPGFYEPYYRTTFDYDYCLMVREKGYKVLLYNNLVLRNKNFTIIEKNILWHHFSAYHRDIYDVYYETRNRLHLWNKYKSFDPEYIKIDKKQQSVEFKEMRLFEKKFNLIKAVIQDARDDYRNSNMGQKYKEIKF